MVLKGIVRLKTSTCFSPLIVAKADLTKTAKVVTFIPPPVDPEPAPININKIKNMRIGVPSSVKSTVLKPAVRVVTD